MNINVWVSNRPNIKLYTQNIPDQPYSKFIHRKRLSLIAFFIAVWNTSCLKIIKLHVHPSLKVESTHRLYSLLPRDFRDSFLIAPRSDSTIPLKSPSYGSTSVFKSHLLSTQGMPSSHYRLPSLQERPPSRTAFSKTYKKEERASRSPILQEPYCSCF